MFTAAESAFTYFSNTVRKFNAHDTRIVEGLRSDIDDPVGNTHVFALADIADQC